MARALVESRRFKAALRLLAGVPHLDVGGHVTAAAAHLGRRDPGRALRHLRLALAQQPAGPEALVQAGLAHQAANHPFTASRWLERAAAVDPDYPGLRAALAGAWRRDARYGEAAALAGEALTGGALAGGERGPASLPDLLYELAMSHAGLGNRAQALAAFRALLAHDPEHAAAWFGTHALALEEEGPDEALRRLDRATRCGGAAGKYWGFVCAYLLLLGREEEARAVDGAHVGPNPKRRPLPDGAAALRPQLAPGFRLFGSSASLLRHALAQATVPGLVLEFGVRRGTSLDHIAGAAGQTVHGFDSFEGLPEGWVNTARGALTTGKQLPPVRPNARLHVGWFEDTLPGFMAAHPEPVRFVNIDSDLYSSARTVLTALAGRLVPGSILVFDEFIGNRSWREDEFRAFHEFAAETGARFEYFAVSPYTKQVAVRLLAPGW
ncbi:hypothetical protein DEW08_02545 [Azospirillum thermophilum]|uniref:Uncharacterized protein n=1 Tax=Azospirillum thermophilum TaxID=2202148 RepID=A0A2S2CN14_9PROT|nr:hypothetical protein DEW08_02545 [Azospirillum thermophilum]